MERNKENWEKSVSNIKMNAKSSSYIKCFQSGVGRIEEIKTKAIALWI